jgi:transposase InsO family protein
MVVIAKTSNKLIRIREFHIDYVGHAQQPLRPHEHWHIDVTYINICGTFFFLCCILDGYSRFIVHWEIRPNMQEPEVEMVVQRAREKFPGERPRIISDNGPQFIARDFSSRSPGQLCELCAYIDGHQ